MHIQPYLFFNGRAEEALHFYTQAVGAEVTTLMRFKDSPEGSSTNMTPKSWSDKVMHANVRIGDTQVMASDGCSQEPLGFHGFSLSLSVGTVAEAEKCFSALADGGKVDMPLSETFWSPRFGMLTDRFGVAWMIGLFDDKTKAA
ncbi:MAG: VOC family protein [Nitrospira sp. LK70]|nr:VOC family protein [Nitrospira sp. LK70]